MSRRRFIAVTIPLIVSLYVQQAANRRWAAQPDEIVKFDRLSECPALVHANARLTSEDHDRLHAAP